MGLVLAGAGCASAVTATHRSDVRASAAVSNPEPRLLVAGPARLLHANIDRRAGVTFLRVPLHASAEPDCRGGVALGWDGESDIEVREDEAVCVAVVHKTRISWHARPIAGAPEPVQHASLLP